MEWFYKNEVNIVSKCGTYNKCLLPQFLMSFISLLPFTSLQLVVISKIRPGSG